MTETRLTEGGTFGPVFSNGVAPSLGVQITEGLVEFNLARHDAILTIELTVEAADMLADALLLTLGRAIPPEADRG